MDPGLVHGILMDNLSRFRTCYQSALSKASTSFNGVIPITFTIGASGSVSKAGVRYNVGNIPSGVQNCVLGVIKSIRFPAPQGGGIVDVSQDLNLFNA
jgi:hypothetical protein